MILGSKHANVQGKITKNQFELASWAHNRVICGLDEVGRGCLAGPVVTAAVIMPPHTTSRLLKDSKLLTEPERLKAYAWIKRHCWYGIGVTHHRLIDTLNIRQATLVAMKRALLHALSACPLEVASIVVDALPLNLTDTGYSSIPVHYFPEAERKSSSVAAASIVAKIHRDALVSTLDAIIPGYQFANHKGYSTLEHMTCLATIGPSIVHRTSFLSATVMPINPQDLTHEHQEQQSIC
ncbi:MAG: ribonuclease HII [Candidatus Babeliales bacterium]